MDAEHTVAFLKDRYHYYSAQYYVAEKEPSLVYQHLRMMEDIEKKNNMNAEQILPQFLWMNYYALAGKYEKAIDLANKLELMLLDKKRFSDWVSVEDFKADLYYIQASCPVLPSDTPEEVASKVHALEYAHYPHVIESLL